MLGHLSWNTAGLIVIPDSIWQNMICMYTVEPRGPGRRSDLEIQVLGYRTISRQKDGMTICVVLYRKSGSDPIVLHSLDSDMNHILTWKPCLYYSERRALSFC